MAGILVLIHTLQGFHADVTQFEVILGNGVLENLIKSPAPIQKYMHIARTNNYHRSKGTERGFLT
jgi:hypothetical protein